MPRNDSDSRLWSTAVFATGFIITGLWIQIVFAFLSGLVGYGNEIGLFSLVTPVLFLIGTMKLRGVFQTFAGVHGPAVAPAQSAAHVQKPVASIQTQDPNEEFWRTPEAKPVEKKKAAPRQVPKASSVNWEEWVGQKLLQKLGVLIVLIGMVVLLKEAFENRWIDELGRLLLAVIVACGLLVSGDVFRKKYAVWAQSFTGGGLALLYFVVWAAHVFYAPVLMQNYGIAVGPTLAFGLYIAITVVGAAAALRYDSQPIAWFTVLGGYLTPLLIDTPAPNAFGLAMYLLILGGGLLFLASRKNWRILEIASFVLSQAYLFGAVYPAPQIGNATQALLAVAFFALFTALPLVRQFGTKLATRQEDIIHMILLCLSVYVPVREALGASSHATTIVAFALAALMLVFSYCALSIRRDDEILVNSYLSGTFLLIALALWAEMGWEWVAAGWAPYSAALLAVAVSLKRKGPWVCAQLLFVASMGILFLHMPMFTETHETIWRPFTSNWALQSYVVFASVVAWIMLLRRVPEMFVKQAQRPQTALALHSILAIMLFAIVTFEATDLTFVPSLTLSYAYVALAAVGIVAFALTGMISWFILAFAVHVILLFFMFATGDGTTLALSSLAAPFWHAWLPVSLAAGAMAVAMLFVARSEMPEAHRRNVVPMMYVLLLAQLWMHGTVEIGHAVNYFGWSMLAGERVLSAWWALVAIGVLALAKDRRWQIAGVVLLAIPELKDLMHIIGGDATFVETIAWTAVPFGLALWGVARKNEIFLKGGVALLGATLGVDVLNALGGSNDVGLLHSIWWGIASLAVLISGFLMKERILRKTGIAMFAVTAGKLLLIDFNALETPVRVAASVGIGLLMIFASYLYQRFDQSSSSK